MTSNSELSVHVGNNDNYVSRGAGSTVMTTKAVGPVVILQPTIAGKQMGGSVITSTGVMDA